MEEIKFGAIPSPKDYRDIHLASVIPTSKVYPDKFFNDISFLPIDHQREIGACVGHAAAKYKQKLDLVDTGKLFSLSPRFVYAICKAWDGYEGEGTYPRLSMKALKEFGCSTEDTLKNDTTLDHETYVFNRDINKIPMDAFRDARDFKISGYASVDLDIDGIKKAIVEANGCSMLVQVGREWYSDKKGNTWDKNRILPIKPPARVISGHQVYVYGYEAVGDDMKIFFINSWSNDWADNGTGWFWFSEYSKYIVEAWTAVDIPTKIINEIKGLPDPKKFKHNFSKVLTFGMWGEDIKALQIALRICGDFKYPEVTGFYGLQTAKAVYEFQTKYQLAGYWELFLLGGKRVGAKTLAKLNSLFNK